MIRVKGDVILVKVSEEDLNKTKSGIYLVHKEQKYSQFAEVIAIGEGLLTEKLVVNKDGEVERRFERAPIENIKVGDTVIVNKYSGQEVRIDDEDYLFIKYMDVLAVLEE